MSPKAHSAENLRWSHEWSHFCGTTPDTAHARQGVGMTTSIMDAHAARLDDPHSTAQRLPLQQRDRVRQCSGDRSGACVPSRRTIDRKSTRLNSSHGYISYAVFCLKKKNKTSEITNIITNIPIATLQRPFNTSFTRFSPCP